jgi:hypothetical protein
MNDFLLSNKRKTARARNNIVHGNYSKENQTSDFTGTEASGDTNMPTQLVFELNLHKAAHPVSLPR